MVTPGVCLGKLFLVSGTMITFSEKGVAKIKSSNFQSLASALYC